jgi:hypothetical protein
MLKTGIISNNPVKKDDDDFDISLSTDESEKKKEATDNKPAIKSEKPSFNTNKASGNTASIAPLTKKATTEKKNVSIDSMDDWDDELSKIPVAKAALVETQTPTALLTQSKAVGFDKIKSRSNDSLDSGDSIASKSNLPLLATLEKSQAKKLSSNLKLSSITTHSSSDQEQKLQHEKEEFAVAYNLKLSTLQQQLEQEYDSKEKSVRTQFQTLLEELESESKRLLLHEVDLLKTIDVQIFEHGPVITFPAISVSKAVSLQQTVEKYRVRFENSLMTLWRRVNDQHDNNLDRMRRKIESENEKELDRFRTTLITEGEARFKMESEKMVHEQTQRLSNLSEQHDEEIKARQQELSKKLKQADLELEKKIYQSEMKVRELEIEMSSKYTEKQREWDVRFAELDASHVKHEKKMREIEQYTSVVPNTMRESVKESETRSMLKKRDEELRQKEQSLVDKEKMLILLEVQLNQRQKHLDNREQKLTEQKDSILKELEATKSELEQNQIEIETQRKELARISHGYPKENVIKDTNESKSPIMKKTKPNDAKNSYRRDSDEDSEYLALRAKHSSKEFTSEQYSSESEYF